jgi:hypothetical protein
MKAIYINPEGTVCYIADCPEEPKFDIVPNADTSDYEMADEQREDYENSLAAAKASAVPFEDQEQARHFTWQAAGLVKEDADTFPFPPGYEVEIQMAPVAGDFPEFVKRGQVAVLTLVKKEGITIDNILSLQKALGAEPSISEIRIVENSVLPDDMMVVSSYLFKQLKKL